MNGLLVLTQAGQVRAETADNIYHDVLIGLICLALTIFIGIIIIKCITNTQKLMNTRKIRKENIELKSYREKTNYIITLEEVEDLDELRVGQPCKESAKG